VYTIFVIVIDLSTCEVPSNPHPCELRQMKEHFTQNAMKPKVMTDALNSAIHNSSSKEN
jgi:hypothetical protein